MGFFTFSELTRDALRGLTEALVVLPLGATEQHGDHLPVSTDAAIVTAIAKRSCAIAGEEVDVLLAATVPVGISGHHLAFGGTLTLSASTYVEVLCDLVTGLRVQGFSRVLFVNGHGGNDSAMRLAVERLAISADITQTAAGLSYWNLLPRDLCNGATFPMPGHAGRFETSLMMALGTDLVELDRALPTAETLPIASNEIAGLHAPRLADWWASGGCTDGIAGADVDLGEAILEGVSREVARVIVAHLAQIDGREQ